MHDIEIRNGVASFVAARTPGWHLLGTTFEDREGITVAEALREAHADYTVYKSESGVEAPFMLSIDGEPVTGKVVDTSKCMTFRLHPDTGEIQHLGTVGKDFQVFQNSEAFQFLETLVDSGEAMVSAAAVLNGGRKAFCCMRLPNHVLIGGVDPVQLYMTASVGHDGTHAYTVHAGAMRVVCANTLTYGLATAKSKWTKKHTKNAKLQAEQARKDLQLTFKYVDALAKEAEELINVEMTRREFEGIVGAMFDPEGKAEDGGRFETEFEKTRADLMYLFSGADTQENIRNTAWGGLQAITEHVDWGRRVKLPEEFDCSGPGSGSADGAMFARSLEGLGETNNLKNQALTLVRDFATSK